ncbi:hypothetical protein [Streptomyces sp. TLI_105]|uniref:hypothetical protein n=1 Tax=Streptomyces sp. TLI_105 TaxID=1881019 RepID=UPI0015A6122F|nr:hypothetical protein [Streptomyces sp. TLI_105]
MQFPHDLRERPLGRGADRDRIRALVRQLDATLIDTRPLAEPVPPSPDDESEEEDVL